MVKGDPVKDSKFSAYLAIILYKAPLASTLFARLSSVFLLSFDFVKSGLFIIAQE